MCREMVTHVYSAVFPTVDHALVTAMHVRCVDLDITSIVMVSVLHVHTHTVRALMVYTRVRLVWRDGSPKTTPWYVNSVLTDARPVYLQQYAHLVCPGGFQEIICALHAATIVYRMNTSPAVRHLGNVRLDARLDGTEICAICRVHQTARMTYAIVSMVIVPRDVSQATMEIHVIRHVPTVMAAVTDMVCAHQAV
jgi:hypothetical protein